MAVGVLSREPLSSIGALLVESRRVGIEPEHRDPLNILVWMPS